MASHYFICQKNHSSKHLNKYNESIIIWYGLWCWVFGISKVQYVMVKHIHEIHLMWSYHMQNYSFESFSHIIQLYYVPWPTIENPTSYDKIMYSTFMCFHPLIVMNMNEFINHNEHDLVGMQWIHWSNQWGLMNYTSLFHLITNLGDKTSLIKTSNEMNIYLDNKMFMICMENYNCITWSPIMYDVWTKRTTTRCIVNVVHSITKPWGTLLPLTKLWRV
jgi:hypothetical protein